MSTEVQVTRLPNCDICAQGGHIQPAKYDAKTIMGPWANLCQKHYEDFGIQLGTGFGQRLVLTKN